MVILRQAHQLNFGQLYRNGRGGIADPVNLQPISSECGLVVDFEKPSLLPLLEDFTLAHVQRDPGFAAVIGTEQTPVLRVALGKVIRGSQGVLMNHLSDRCHIGILPLDP